MSQIYLGWMEYKQIVMILTSIIFTLNAFIVMVAACNNLVSDGSVERRRLGIVGSTTLLEIKNINPRYHVPGPVLLAMYQISYELMKKELLQRHGRDYQQVSLPLL